MFKQIYNKILSRPIALLGFVQGILIMLVFWQMIVHPNDYMFTNVKDGLKNYFTFTQYLTQEPSDAGFLHFSQMNYPFGEYVFFTDNTPILAVPLRWINQNLFSIEGNMVAIHNWVFLFNLWLTPFLFFMILKPFAKKKIFLALFLSLSFAWINPQVVKLAYGVYNLSLSVVLLSLLFLFQRIHQSWFERNVKLFKLALAVFVLLLLSAGAHIYYVPIIALALGLFTLSEWILNKGEQGKRNWRAFLILNASTITSGLIYYMFIQWNDKYADLRRATASGFDLPEWKFTPEAIFTPVHYNALYPLIRHAKNPIQIPHESFGFWGNFVLLSIILSFIYMGTRIVKKSFLWTDFKQLLARNTFLLALLITAFFSYATASGVYIKMSVIPLSFDNVFSPFYYLYKHVDLITQFRCLARFSWMGYWIIALFGSVLFFKLIDSLSLRKPKLSVLFSFLLCAAMLWDVAYAMLFHSKVHQTNLFQEELLADKFQNLDAIDFNAYQAIFTIPATQVGSENYEITIDDQPYWSRHWMQLSAYTGLPQFNCKMSRTAENQAKAQIDLLLNQEVPELILNNLNTKPILVVYSPENEQYFDLKVLDYAKPASENGSQIIKAFQMDTILVDNSVYYLHWDVKNYH